jgi:hypothetical protein
MLKAQLCRYWQFFLNASFSHKLWCILISPLLVGLLASGCVMLVYYRISIHLGQIRHHIMSPEQQREAQTRVEYETLEATSKMRIRAGGAPRDDPFSKALWQFMEKAENLTLQNRELRTQQEVASDQERSRPS